MKKKTKAKPRRKRLANARLMVTKKELAKAWGCSTRWVERLMKEHGMPGPVRNRFSRVTHGKWYVAFLDRALEKYDVVSEVTIVVGHDKLRFIRAKRVKAEIKLARLQANLVPAQVLRDFEAGWQQDVRRHFDGDWADGIAAKVAGLDEREMRIVLDREVRAQLHKVAALAEAPLASEKTQ